MRVKTVETINRNKELIWIFTKREIEGKYRGSALGILWSVINPLIMLGVYTVVFSRIFNARWGDITGETADKPIFFAINLFAGLIVFNMFAECASKSTQLITSNPNYVKKVVFPLEVLGIATTGGALYQALISVTILIMVKLMAGEVIASNIIFIPVLWGSYAIGICGVCWLLSLLGVVIKDVGQIMGSLINIMMFISPVFYSKELVPETIRWIADINPIAYVITETRLILIKGEMPKLSSLIIFSLCSIMTCEIALRILKRNQRKLGDWL